MAPSKKGIVFTTGRQDIEDDSNNSWNDDDRHESRSLRIRSRIPTGHPQMAKKILQQLEEEDEDETSSQQSTKPICHKAEKKRSSSKKKSSSKEEKTSSSRGGGDKESSRGGGGERESSSKKKKSSSKKKVTSSEEDVSEEIVIRKKSHKKKKVVMSESESEPEREVKTKHKSHKKKRDVHSDLSEDEMGSDEGVGVHKSSRKKKYPEEVKMGRTTVVEGGDSSWDEEQRKQERFNRIRKRVPTGHPGLAKKIMTLQKQFADSEGSDMEETEATPPKTKKSSSKSKKPSSSSIKKRHKSEAIHFGEAKKVDSDSEGSWEEEHRKEERYTRIRSRVPTGHPGLAKKLLAAQAEMDEEGDD